MTQGRRQNIMAAVAVAVLVYVGCYLALRVGHRIMHYSNSHHLHPEKCSPEHYVSVARDADEWACAVFQPLMLLEKAYHSVVDD